MSVTPPHRRLDLLLSLALAVGCFVVFVLLPQQTLHGFDSDLYAALLQAGETHRAPHIAFLPICSLVASAGGWLGGWPGGGAVRAMFVTTALGSAIGIFGVHRAALVFCERRTAAAVAVGVAVTPACFYYATAVEIHGVFAAGSGLAWWAFATWCRTPVVARAVGVGVATGLAATIHNFGHVLPVLFVAIAAVQRRAPPRALVLAAACIGAAHAVATIAVALSLGHGPMAQFAPSGSAVAKWSDATDLGRAGEVAWRECVLPFLPWSLLAVCGLAAGRARPWALAFLIGVLLHAPVAVMLLARPGTEERGGYLLPVAVPAVLAAAALLPRVWLWLAAAVALAASLLVVVPRWPPAFRAEFVVALAELRQQREFSALVGPAEIDGVRTHFEQHFRGMFCAEVDRTFVPMLHLLGGQPEPALRQTFDALIESMGGASKTWLVTAAAAQRFEQFPAESVRALWRDHVPAHYVLERVQRPGLDGVWLRRRP